MALSRDQKEAVVDEVSRLLTDSKLTVIARYSGTSVKAMQDLRKHAKNSETQVRVIKNRLAKTAIAKNDNFKNINTSFLKGQLMYAFNAQDEVAPAQSLAEFAKEQPQIEFIAAIAADGTFLPAEEVKLLANLPSKQQLRGQLAGLIESPLSGFTAVVGANLRGVLNVLNARAQTREFKKLTNISI